MKVKDPLCPKCGCPPRAILGTFQVRLGVQAGRLLNGTWTNELTPTGDKRVGKPVGNLPLTLECGFRHQWTTEETP